MLRIKKLHLLLARSYIAPLFASFSVALFILVLQFLAKYQDDIFGKGFGGWVLAQLFVFTSIQLSILAFPIAVLIASLTTMGRLGENYELAALKASGISLFRILSPLILLTTCVTLLSLGLSWFVVPKINLKLYSLLWDVQQAKPELVLKPGYFNTKIENVVIYFSDRSISGKLKNIKLWDHTEQRGNVKVVSADSASIQIDKATQYLRLTLYHGAQYYENPPETGKPDMQVYARTYFDTLLYKLDMSGFGLKRTEEKWFSSHQYMRTMPELLLAIDSLTKTPEETLESMNNYVKPFLKLEETFNTALPTFTAQKDTYFLATLAPDKKKQLLNQALTNARTIKSYTEFSKRNYHDQLESLRRYLIEFHLRFTLPIACLVLLFVGAPLGAIIRKGGLGLPTVISIIFFIFFYALMTQGRKLARENTVEVWFGMWLPVLVMIPIALFVVYQSATDSRLFDLSSWKYLTRFWKKRR